MPHLPFRPSPASRPVPLLDLLAISLLALCLVPLPALADGGEDAEEKGPLGHLTWRNIGPVNMSGRVSDVEGVPGDPSVLYVGTAAGGIWKTENGGTTFEPIFDDEEIASIGDLGLAPSNPSVIYAGTGEANVRNSVSFGGGVYKSTDGGASWSHLGLEGTRFISRVVVDPSDPDTVFVGALGTVYGESEERGVYRSTDGGASWQKVLYIDDEHGVADMDIDPSNPEVVYAAMWRFTRRPWTHESGSEEGGVWRSVDGGDSWQKVTEGLPELMGRIGIKVAPSNPKVVYVIAESDQGTLFRSDDRGASFRKVTDETGIVSRGFYYTDMRVDPADENRLYAVSSRLQRSIDGGETWERIARTVHVDFHSLWIDPEDPRRMWNGQDGGIAVSYDRGDNWQPIHNLPIGQYYQVFHDDRQPFYQVGGGLQDNGTWYGPSRTREPMGILPDDWRMMSFGDAYWVVPHPENHQLFISESQAGGIVKTDMATRQQRDISPQPRRNDGGPVEALEYRFNWNAPIVASPHDPLTVYFAGNVVFKSTDFGESWQAISPDLTTDDPDKQGTAGGPAWTENTTAEYHCTIISFAESPVSPGVLWVGTDDGNLQLSRDGGASWDNLIGAVPGVPEHSPVSHVEPSRQDAGTAWIAFDRHMFDDFAPHLFVTEDFGASWRRLSTDGLPENGWVWVVRQDPVNADLLYAGTELGLFASWDRGTSWRELDLANFPTTPVQDILIHPRANDLILGTHGRAIWIFDDATPVQRFGEVEAALDRPHLLPIRDAMRFTRGMTRYGVGDQLHRAPNPAYGALITYHLPEKIEPPMKGKGGGEGEDGEGGEGGEGGEEDESGGEEAAGGAEDDEAMASGEMPSDGMGGKKEDRVKIEIVDPASGDVLRTMKQRELGLEKGLNRVAWDLAEDGPEQREDREQEGNEFFGPPQGASVLPGSYTVRLTVDGESFEQPVTVTLDPSLTVSPADLEEAYRLSASLVPMESAANTAMRGLDHLKGQIAERQKTAKGLKRELSTELREQIGAAEKRIGELLALLTREEGKPFWSQGPRLGSLIGGLQRDVDRAFAAPTAAQAELAGELTGELEAALGQINGFYAEGAADLDAALEEAGLPGLLIPDEVTVERPE